MNKRSTSLFFLVIIASCTLFLYCKEATDYQANDEFDISYGNGTLDIHGVTCNSRNLAPVLVFIHGGGWNSGDKTCWSKNQYEYFRKNGIISISVNYSLTDSKTNKNFHPTHINDIAAATKWIYDNIEDYGGNRKNLYIMGHSSGAHLVALLSTNEKYLHQHGLKTRNIRGIILLDVGRYLSKKDIVFLRLESKSSPFINEIYKVWTDAFGKDSTMWADALPADCINQQLYTPPILLIHSDLPFRLNANKEFEGLLLKAEKDVERLMVPDLDHMAFVTYLGTPSDTFDMSSSIANFIRK